MNGSRMNKTKFLGTGVAFPLQPNGAGGLGYVSGQAHVEQSLRLLLMTALGERVMRPGLGCKAPQLVFAPGSLQYLRLLESSVREAVRDWEPRVELENVIAEANPQAQNQVTVQIAYKIRASNARGNLVFPFYLGTDFGPDANSGSTDNSNNIEGSPL